MCRPFMFLTHTFIISFVPTRKEESQKSMFNVKIQMMSREKCRDSKVRGEGNNTLLILCPMPTLTFYHFTFYTIFRGTEKI